MSGGWHEVNKTMRAAKGPSALMCVVTCTLENMDSINVSTALHCIGRFAHMKDMNNTVHGELCSAVQSHDFGMLVQKMTELCTNKEFSPRSTSNVWWALAKLYVAAKNLDSDELIPSQLGQMLAALETALVEGDDDAEVVSLSVSTIWYSVGAIVANGGPHPSPRLLGWMLHYLHEFRNEFDARGVANIVMAIGQLCTAMCSWTFHVPNDTLVDLIATANVCLPGMTVQGLVCCVAGCARMHPDMHNAVRPFVAAALSHANHRCDDPMFVTSETMFTVVSSVYANMPSLLEHACFWDLMTTFMHLATTRRFTRCDLPRLLLTLREIDTKWGHLRHRAYTMALAEKVTADNANAILGVLRKLAARSPMMLTTS